MADNENLPQKNTDVELWRESDDHYSPSIHVTEEGYIGINVGGHAYVADVRDWHQAMARENERTIDNLNLLLTEGTSEDDMEREFLNIMSALDEMFNFVNNRDRRRFFNELLVNFKKHYKPKI